MSWVDPQNTANVLFLMWQLESNLAMEGSAVSWSFDTFASLEFFLKHGSTLFLPVSNIFFVTVPGARGSTHSSGFTTSGISSGSQAAHMMSEEAKSHGGGTPRGGTTSTVQSICKWESSWQRRVNRWLLRSQQSFSASVHLLDEGM